MAALYPLLVGGQCKTQLPLAPIRAPAGGPSFALLNLGVQFTAQLAIKFRSCLIETRVAGYKEIYLS